MNEQKPLVIYHYPCQDGFTAAWAIWKVHPDWDFVPAKHGGAIPDVTGRDVYMVDFSYKRPVILEMAEKANTIRIIDHHKTAEADLVDLPFNVHVTFNMDKSGARLTWDEFHPDKTTPALVHFVEDRDLWRFKYGLTKGVTSAIFALDYTFENWDRLADEIESQVTNVYDRGAAILAKQEKDINELSQNKFRFNIGGYKVWTVNVPYTLASDMGNLLAKGEPFASTYFYDGEGYVFSLRSNENGIDVSEIAKQYGGGGHKHAAGFKMKSQFIIQLPQEDRPNFTGSIKVG